MMAQNGFQINSEPSFLFIFEEKGFENVMMKVSKGSPFIQKELRGAIRGGLIGAHKDCLKGVLRKGLIAALKRV